MRRYSIFGGNDYFLSVEDRLWQAIQTTIRGIVQLHEKDQRKTMTTEKQKAVHAETTSFEESAARRRAERQDMRNRTRAVRVGSIRTALQACR
jgi:hypothetical protein